MDENTWRFAQLIMWALGAQTAILTGIIGIMWHHFNKKFDKVDQRLERIEDKINLPDKRLVAVETFLHMKDCCMLKDDRIKQKAE